jgi:hypothetical protein
VSHGRIRRPGRSAVTGPLIAPRRRRSDFFTDTVFALVEHLRDIAPAEIEGMTVTIQAMPSQPDSVPGIARWRVDKDKRHVTLFRLPIERLSGGQSEDPWQRRIAIEAVVIRAVAELIDWDPWRLAHGGHGFS